MHHPEKIRSHIVALQTRHLDLEKQINELKNHHAEDSEINTLKKEKLRLKDEIAEYEELLNVIG